MSGKRGNSDSLQQNDDLPTKALAEKGRREEDSG